jgi:hypothetical protein
MRIHFSDHGKAFCPEAKLSDDFDFYRRFEQFLSQTP